MLPEGQLKPEAYVKECIREYNNIYVSECTSENVSEYISEYVGELSPFSLIFTLGPLK